MVTGQAVNCLRTFAREFRYDTGRARYLMRDLDLATLLPSASYAGLWTDYAQDTAYGDYTLSPGAGGPAAATAARYQPGAWERAGDALRVHHGDQIGTSRFMTGASAQTLRRAVYTAFGELVLADDGHGQPPAVSRYDYAGAWGYETGLDDAGEPDLPPLPFVHVGERWYDPSTGRFLQRDPIGIAGGLNVFAYVMSEPVTSIDASGLVSSLMRPDGVVAFLQTELTLGGGTIWVKWGGVTYVVKDIVLHRGVGGRNEITFFTICGQKTVQFLDQGPLMEVVKQGPTFVVTTVQKGGGACGCTGLEIIVPLGLTRFFQRIFRRRRRLSNDEQDYGELVLRTKDYWSPGDFIPIVAKRMFRENIREVVVAAENLPELLAECTDPNWTPPSEAEAWCRLKQWAQEKPLCSYGGGQGMAQVLVELDPAQASVIFRRL